MPFKIIGSDKLDSVVNIRLTKSEKERLKDDAEMASISMSELVRKRYFGRPIIANTDAIMIKELRRIGGLLKHIHLESQGNYSKSTASTINTLKAYIEKLSDRKKG